jgi:hypothetical protein
MIRSGLEYLKMLFQIPLKMIIFLRIHQATENYKQTMGSHVLKTEDTDWCQEFAL